MSYRVKVKFKDKDGFFYLDDAKELIRIADIAAVENGVGEIISPLFICGFVYGRLKQDKSSVGALYNDYHLKDDASTKSFLAAMRQWVKSQDKFTLENVQKWFSDRGYVGYGLAEVLREKFANNEFTQYIDLSKEKLLAQIKYWVKNGHNGYSSMPLEHLLNIVRGFAIEEKFKSLDEFLVAFSLKDLPDVLPKNGGDFKDK